MKTAIEFIKEWLDIPFHKDREKSGNIDISTLALMDMMDKFANQSKWIDVNERLPEESEENGVKVIGYIESDVAKKWMYGNIREVVFYHGKFHLDFKKGYIQNVTHWQPLPKNPTE